MKVQLLVVGALHVDEIARSHESLQLRASNPVIWSRRVGGVAFNAALSVLRHATAISPGLRAVVGDDTTAQQIETALDSIGLRHCLSRIPTQRSGRYTAVLDKSGELYLGLADTGLSEQLSQTDLQPLLSATNPCAILFDTNLSESCIEHLVAYAAQRTIPIGALTVSPLKACRIHSSLSQLSVIFCNRREAMALTAAEPEHSPSLNTLADDLQGLGCQCFVLTDGGSPLIVQDRFHRMNIGIPAVTITETVNGAGDALAGASFAHWCTGRDNKGSPVCNNSASMDLESAVRLYGLPAAASVITGKHKPVLLDQQD